MIVSDLIKTLQFYQETYGDNDVKVQEMRKISGHEVLGVEMLKGMCYIKYKDND